MDGKPFRLASCFCVAILGVTGVSAANVEYLWDQTDQLPQLNQFHINNHSKESLPGNIQLFKLNNKVNAGLYEFRLRNAFVDPERISHARYDEYYKNLRVLWADSIVHRKKSQSINGTLVTGIEKDVKSVRPKLSQERASVIAQYDFQKRFSNKTVAPIRVLSSELVIYPYHKNKAHLAYHVNYFTTVNERLVNPDYIVDANNGKILNYYDDLKRAEAQVGTGPGGNTNPALSNGTYNYGVGAAPLADKMFIQTDTPVAGQCTWSNRGVGAVSLGNATNIPNKFPVLQTDEINFPLVIITNCNAGNSYANPNDNGEAPANGGLSPDNDILFYATQTYNLFTTYSVSNPQFPFGTTSTASTPVVRFYVHIDSVDAFAQNAGCGNVPDACYNQQVVFGNGQTQYYPQVGYDVVGHETAHIYTGRTSNLVYANQSGGMNEAFADITGASLGAYIGNVLSWFPPISNTPPLNNPLGISFWTQGSLDNKTSAALRYLYNPPLDGSSIDNANNYTAGMGVHFSSGVYNKAFYNFAMSMSNNPLVDYAAVLRAYRIFVAANDTYWTANVDFYQGSCGVILAASNPVYGGNSQIQTAATNAFAQVGVRCKRNINKILVA